MSVPAVTAQSDDSAPCTALIGHTGFVGSNLLRQRSFDATFNSANIDEIAGRSFDLVVCAGAPAEKWKANADPERDLDNIERLIRALEQVNTQKLVLISTVDVFATPVEVDEDTPAPMAGLPPYGHHRRRLEQMVAGRFDATIVRLAGLVWARAEEERDSRSVARSRGLQDRLARRVPVL